MIVFNRVAKIKSCFFFSLHLRPWFCLRSSSSSHSFFVLIILFFPRNSYFRGIASSPRTVLYLPSTELKVSYLYFVCTYVCMHVCVCKYKLSSNLRVNVCTRRICEENTSAAAERKLIFCTNMLCRLLSVGNDTGTKSGWWL